MAPRTAKPLPFWKRLRAHQRRLDVSAGELAAALAVALKDVGLGKLHRVTVQRWLTGDHAPPIAEQLLILVWLQEQTLIKLSKPRKET